MKIIVVGAGYAGLCTALRLRLKGCDVTVLDQGLIGSGPSGNNHGILHSGALYSILHPEVVPGTIRAQDAYARLFGKAKITTKPSVYIAGKEKSEEYRKAWSATNIEFHPFDITQLEGILNLEHVGSFKAYEVPHESTYSNYEMLSLLVSYCLDVGVRIETQVKVTSVIIKNKTAIGVEIASLGEVMYADNVVLSAGLGTQQFMEIHADSRLISSRIDMMVAFVPKSPLLDRNVLVSEFGGPTMAPARNNYVLAATYGCPQPSIDRYKALTVPYAVAHNQAEQLQRFLDKKYFDVDTMKVYMCTKTEYVDPMLKDAWGVSPGYKIFDMYREAKISNLWALLPGKMTLAMEASRELAEKIIHQEEPLAIELPFSIEHYSLHQDAEKMVATAPWL